MKIFLTGATSSIGQYVVKYLVEKGHTLNLLVRSKEKAFYLESEYVNFFEGDLNDIDVIELAIKDCDQVYHLAAIAKVWLKNTSTFFDINVQGTVNILNLALKYSIKKIVVTSTAGTFGPSIQEKVSEKTIRKVDFFNEYESSKFIFESIVKMYVYEKGMNIVIVSPTRVFGPILNGFPSSTNLLISKYLNGNWRFLPGTGNEIGNYAFVEDVAKGHILAMNKGKAGQIYILGGENLSYKDFFMRLSLFSGIERKMICFPFWIQTTFSYIQLFKAKLFSKEPSITPKWIVKAKFDWEVSSQRAVNEIGYSITTFETSIQKTINSLKR